ncbi:hypothetical protein TNCV_5061271 [Trichonephila clavipes]|nr:hypothetical protein TNCV_5061271 [Trichonephila clavipes]
MGRKEKEATQVTTEWNEKASDSITEAECSYKTASLEDPCKNVEAVYLTDSVFIKLEADIIRFLDSLYMWIEALSTAYKEQINDQEIFAFPPLEREHLESCENVGLPAALRRKGTAINLMVDNDESISNPIHQRLWDQGMEKNGCHKYR